VSPVFALGVEPVCERISQSVFLIGGGGHALVVFEAARLAGRQIVGFYDDCTEGSLIQRASVQLGSFDDLLNHRNPAILEADGILAVGNLELRRTLLRKLDSFDATVVHPSAVVSPNATVGAGSFVAACAIVGSNAHIGRHSIINTRAIIEHDCRLAENVHVGPAAVLGGGVKVGADTLIGLNSCVKPNVEIGRNCVVGAGAVVVDRVPDGEVVVGIPAKPIRYRGTHQKVA